MGIINADNIIVFLGRAYMLTPRLELLLNKANKIATHDLESAKRSSEKLALSFKKNNSRDDENKTSIKIPKDLSLTARMEKLVEKVESIALQAAHEKEIRQIDDLVAFGEKDADEHQIIEEHQDW